MACGGDRSVNVLNAFTNVPYRKELVHKYRTRPLIPRPARPDSRGFPDAVMI